MIPQRVELEGFLCYKQKETISFGGASLWLLAGLNGSGKSSIFDAVTYALFGHHRGGNRDAHELINKDSDRATVEFEFALDGEYYKIKRTLQRTRQGRARPTRQVFHRIPEGKWEAVEDTQLDAGFDEWVNQHIGLSYETFTSSVLLLQGKAEKLLDSTAKGRFEVLAGIVDLERYDRLHRRADEQRKELEGRVKSLTGRLNAVPEVPPLLLIEAESRIADAAQARQQTQEEVERWQGLEFQAQRWADLQGRLGEARHRLRLAETLLADAPAIEKAVERLRELGAVLPQLQTVLEQRNQVQDSERKTAEYLQHRAQAGGRLADQDETLDQARQRRLNLQGQLADDERRLRQVGAELRTVTALVEKLKEYERQENDLARLREELQRTPADPAAAVQKARVTCEALDALNRVLPSLTRLQALRAELGQAAVREEAARAAWQATHQKGDRLKAEVARLRPLLQEATGVRQQADEAATRARTLQEQARQSLNELMLLRGSKICRHCGQQLTPGHIGEEKKRRTQEVIDADDRAKKTAAEQKAARQREADLTVEVADREKALADAREDYVREKAEADQARKEVERLQRECAQTYADLPDSFRERVSPTLPGSWLDTTYPTAEELARERQRASGLPTVRKGLADAEKAMQHWGLLKDREATLRQTVARLQTELPANPQGLRQDHARLEAEEQSLQRGSKARRDLADNTQKAIDRLMREREQTQQTLTQVQGKLNTEETVRQQCRQVLDRALKELPPSWHAVADGVGTAEVYQLCVERDDLTRARTEERARELHQAQSDREALSRALADLQAQEAPYPPEARQEPEKLKVLLSAAQQMFAERDRELSDARKDWALLENRHDQRQQLQQEYLRVDAELNHARLLAELLSRDRLQLHLVRQAERQVVDHANAVLDRLSGGQLYLRLAGEAGGDGNTAKALELEAHNRVTGEKPINVAFLSGSQKFRVAVSLALGIGQYASRQHRPIESVIIDEGFGCLDRHGRQVMIQELQNLRGQLRCILLVSHQEEFAEAFADGYHFELQGGTAVARRFQR